MLLFKDTIAEKINLDGFTPEEKREITVHLQEIIITRVHTALLDLLPPADQEEFYAISEKPYSPELVNFLKEKIPNVKERIDKIVEDSIEEFNKLRS